MNDSREMSSREWFRNGAAIPSTVHHIGLGFYSAERIVETHVGSIDVTSLVEDGMRLTVTLPR